MNRKEHKHFEKWMLGAYFRPIIDRILDDRDELREFGNKHRKISHTWERLEGIRALYGGAGRLQALLHIYLDYGFIPEKLVRGIKNDTPTDSG